MAAWWRVALAGVILTGSLLVGFRGSGAVPPLGPLLDPWRGVWAVALTGEFPTSESVQMSGLQDSVRVVYDDRGVPHIFASTPLDAYRTMGFVVARDRLFQIELSVRASEGTLSELIGPRALSFDRSQRRWALRWSAERVLERVDWESEAGKALAAYADGINRWIELMGPRDLPLEYRLFGATPRRWEPVHSLIVTKRMGWTLARWNPDLRRLRMQALVGEEAARALLPEVSPIQEPIQPRARGAPRAAFPEPPPPGTPDPAASSLLGALGAGASVPGIGARPPDVLASNNWAVAPGRTASGYALLAGDPHLDLTLPSIWYEAHLVVPGQLDVYGASVAGIPGIVIGFNRDVAWTFTNTGADVLDYYAETLDDEDAPTAYLLDGEWKPLVVREEVFRDRRGRRLATDSVYFTHRGPLRRDRPRPLSVRWTVYDDTTGARSFLQAARSTSARDFLEAMSAFQTPAQNMIVADREGHIAARSVGLYPIRPGDGDGAAIRDGSTSASDWIGYWPLARYPQAFDPAQQFLATANQQPIDPAADDAYLGADWPSPWRAMRINELLRGDERTTYDAMRRYQTDPGSTRADYFVPVFLAAANASLRQREDALLREATEFLADWDRRYSADNERAVLFEAAMRSLIRATWDELADAGGALNPSEAVLAGLLAYPENAWWDRRDTPEVTEDRDQILVSSLREGLRQTRIDHGAATDGGWRWSAVRFHNILHLLRFPSFSALRIPAQGGPGTLSPAFGDGTHGASWRMVVELGPSIRACTIYPGGQSGNPMSPRYADRIEKWATGKLDCVRFPHDASELDAAHTMAVLDVIPEPVP